MSTPRFLFNRVLSQDLELLKKRQQRLEQSLIEMQQQIYKLQMTSTITDDPNVQCVPPPDSSTFNWVATGLFFVLGIGAVVCARSR